MTVRQKPEIFSLLETTTLFIDPQVFVQIVWPPDAHYFHAQRPRNIIVEVGEREPLIGNDAIFLIHKTFCDFLLAQGSKLFLQLLPAIHIKGKIVATQFFRLGVTVKRDEARLDFDAS